MERSLVDLKGSFSIDKDNNLRIPKKALEGFIHKAGVLLRMIEPFGFNFSNAESIINTTQAGKLFFSKTHQLVVDREELIISSGIPETEIAIEETTELTFTNDPGIAYVDADKVGALVLRNWEEGDFFYPLGMKGKKKVSDFLIDEKISVTEKQSIKVVTTGDQIVWVVGKRIDDRFKITPTTKRVLIIKKTTP
ncbi:MAG: tRNA lysidine(34) synthetase TilS [Bacteroidota bacterium]